MSTLRKALKICCFVLMIAGVALVYPAVTALLFGAQIVPAGLLQAVLLILCVVFDFVLGVMGIPAANVPSRAIKLLPVIIAGLTVNAAAVLYLIYIGGMVLFASVNALLVFAFGAAAHLVNKEYLASR